MAADAGAGAAAAHELLSGPVAVEAFRPGTSRPHSDAWFTSDVHRRYAGAIVFSRRRVDPPRERESLFARTFTRQDPLYGRVYLDRSLANTPVAVPGMRPIWPSEGAHFVRMLVDGKPFDGGSGLLHGALRLASAVEDRQLTTWRFEPHPAPADTDGDPSELALAWARAVNRLGPGRHRIRLELWAGDLQQHSATPRAAGELTLVAGREDFVSARPAPAEGYAGRDREALRAAAVGLFAQAQPPLTAARVVIRKVWGQRLEPGVRHALVVGRGSDADGDRLCEWRAIQLHQSGGPGAWRATRLEECRLPECTSEYADCE